MMEKNGKMDSETRELLEHMHGDIQDLGQSVLMLSVALAEAGKRLKSLEAQVAIHDIALYPNA